MRTLICAGNNAMTDPFYRYKMPSVRARIEGGRPSKDTFPLRRIPDTICAPVAEMSPYVLTFIGHLPQFC